MNTLRIPVRPEGALVEIAVGLAYPDVRIQRQAGRPVPDPVPVLALIDTGAQATAVDPAALTAVIGLGIQPTRFVFVNLSGAGTQPSAEYAVGLAVGPTATGKKPIFAVRSQLVIAQDLAPLGYQAIIGRDLLAQCLLIYDGPGNSVTLGA
jgi:hypothetical protein